MNFLNGMLPPGYHVVVCCLGLKVYASWVQARQSGEQGLGSLCVLFVGWLLGVVLGGS